MKPLNLFVLHLLIIFGEEIAIIVTDKTFFFHVFIILNSHVPMKRKKHCKKRDSKILKKSMQKLVKSAVSLVSKWLSGQYNNRNINVSFEFGMKNNICMHNVHKVIMQLGQTRTFF